MSRDDVEDRDDFSWDDVGCKILLTFLNTTYKNLNDASADDVQDLTDDSGDDV